MLKRFLRAATAIGVTLMLIGFGAWLYGGMGHELLGMLVLIAGALFGGFSPITFVFLPLATAWSRPVEDAD